MKKIKSEYQKWQKKKALEAGKGNLIWVVRRETFFQIFKENFKIF